MAKLFTASLLKIVRAEDIHYLGAAMKKVREKNIPILVNTGIYEDSSQDLRW